MSTEVLTPPDAGKRADAQAAPAALESSAAAQVLEKLNGLFLPSESLRWLGTPQARLGGSPIELIERGQAERILHLLIRLEEGIPL